MLLIRRGARATAKQRMIRIAAPFVLALLLIQPILAALWGLGYSAQWGFPAARTVEVMLKTSWGIEVPGSPAEPVRLWHLWFLYELIWFCAAGVLIATVCPKQLRLVGNLVGRVIASAIGSWWGVFVLALPMGLMLLLHNPTGADPNTTLVPNWASLGYYALPFAAGWLVYRFKECFGRLARIWWWPMGLALLVAFPVYVNAMGRGAVMPDGPRSAALVATAMHALMTAGFSLGMIGLFTRLLDAPGPRVERWVRYGSDSAYWVYLAHMPIVVWLGILLVDWRANPWLKMGVVLAGSGVLLLVSYQLLVRHTPIGRLLNGRRGRHARVSSTMSPLTPENSANPPPSMPEGAP